MNRDDIIRMAREACGDPAWDGGVDWVWGEVERFANLVAAAEREACAKVCDELVLEHPGRADLTAKQCALTIRERGGEMTEEELSKMISEFLPYPAEGQHYALKQFAKLVAAAEREACAKVCMDKWMEWMDASPDKRLDMRNDAEDCAFAIRERGAP